MSNIIKTPLSDRQSKAKSVTRSNILPLINSDATPSIYINDTTAISVSDGILRYGNKSIYLLNKTVIEIVGTLRDNGVNAFLTDIKMAGLPAILLNDFNSNSILVIDIESSPIRLSEYHGEYSKNLIALSESNIIRSIAAIVATNVRSGLDRDIFYSKDVDDLYSYEVSNDLLYVNNLDSPTKCIMSYSINNYFLFSSNENLLNTYNIIDKYNNAKINSHELDNLLKAINSNNKDVL